MTQEKSPSTKRKADGGSGIKPLPSAQILGSWGSSPASGSLLSGKQAVPVPGEKREGPSDMGPEDILGLREGLNYLSAKAGASFPRSSPRQLLRKPP